MMIGTGIEAYINIGSGGQAVKKVKDINVTEYTLQAEDVDFVLQFRADANIKILVPAGLPEDGRYEGKQLGDGMIALDNDEGVTIAGTDFATYATIAKNSHFALDWTAIDTYVVNDFERLDATSTRKGGIRLAGDLAGTANNPTVPTKLNKAANPEYESLADTSEKHGFALFSRLGAIFRSPSLLWDETLKKLTIKGSQAIWEAYQDVTDGNMGIKALAAATEAFKLFDTVGNFFSVGTDSGKRLVRIFTAFRLMNGTSYNETEYKAIECEGSVTTLLKSVSIPANAIVTVDVFNISVMNIDKNYIIGHSQFSFKNDAGTVTNISRDELRYGRQYSSIAGNFVTGTDTRIDASVSGTTASINFVNTINKLTNVHCEIKFTITLIPES